MSDTAATRATSTAGAPSAPVATKRPGRGRALLSGGQGRAIGFQRALSTRGKGCLRCRSCSEMPLPTWTMGAWGSPSHPPGSADRLGDGLVTLKTSLQPGSLPPDTLPRTLLGTSSAGSDPEFGPAPRCVSETASWDHRWPLSPGSPRSGPGLSAAVTCGTYPSSAHCCLEPLLPTALLTTSPTSPEVAALSTPRCLCSPRQACPHLRGLCPSQAPTPVTTPVSIPTCGVQPGSPTPVWSTPSKLSHCPI